MIQAILDGAAQIVTPAFVSLLCICIVFVPMFFLPGVAGFLFVPMALAVVFAMIASFILSRTLVPTMAMYLLKPHDADMASTPPAPSRNPLARFQRGFEKRFEQVRAGYGGLLERALGRAQAVRDRLPRGRAALVPAGAVPRQQLLPDASMPARSRCTSARRSARGSRIRRRSSTASRRKSARIIPADELATIIDNIGLPVSGINTVYNNSGTIGPQDGDILITLKEGHKPTAGLHRRTAPRAAAATSRARPSRSCPPTSPARS